ncbi:MAG: oligosaccharide flippase family protein, partial [Flavobacteriaceae bacterium]|nr:oligosaccharide flippase family protein [Candidatus Onthonaster equi]
MNNQFLKNLSYLTLIQISNAFIPLLIIPYISRIIGVQNFSSLEFTRIYCYYFTIFINYGFDLTITRYISINRDDSRKVNSMVNQAIYAKVFLLIISSVFFLASLEFYEALESLQYLLLLTFLINVGYVFYPIWFFQGIEKMAKISIINFISKFIIAV